MMDTTLLIFIILGLLQGFTEVLPISSSGHLALFREITSLKDLDLAVAAGLHGGSLLAIAYWFRLDVVSLWQSSRALLSDWISWFRHRNPNVYSQTNARRLPLLLLASLVPAAVMGLLLKEFAENAFTQVHWVPILLILNGLLFLVTAWWTRGERILADLGVREYLLIGTFQGFAVFPGIASLGVTLCTGLILGLNWYDALRLAFLLAIPILAGGIIIELPTLLQVLANSPQLVLGFFTSFTIVIFTSLFGLWLFTSSMLERRTLRFFGLYCCMIGIFALSLFSFWN